MNVPHTIPSHTREVYDPPAEVLAPLVGRRTFSEDFDAMPSRVTSLRDDCLWEMTKEYVFASAPFAEMQPTDVDRFVEILAVDDEAMLPRAIAEIHDEHYWERWCSGIRLEKRPSSSWKAHFLTTYLQDKIEKATLEDNDGTVRIATMVSEYVETLTIRRLQKAVGGQRHVTFAGIEELVYTPTDSIPSDLKNIKVTTAAHDDNNNDADKPPRNGIAAKVTNIDKMLKSQRRRSRIFSENFDILAFEHEHRATLVEYNHFRPGAALARLSQLVELHLIFDTSDRAFTYRDILFRLSLRDVAALAADAIGTLAQLRRFTIKRCYLDAARARALVKNGLSQLTALSDLEISHCLMDEGGFEAVAEMLTMRRSGGGGGDWSMASLTLRDNDFGDVKMAAVKGVVENVNSIDLSRNTLAKETSMHLALALIKAKEIPKRLTLAGCCLTGFTSNMIAAALEYNKSIEFLDISANDFSGQTGSILLQSLKENHTLKTIDMRSTEISDEHQAEINDLLTKNKTNRSR